MKRIEFLCGHCRAVCATATGEWADDEALFPKEGFLCEDCAGCDKAPPHRSILDAVLGAQ